MQVHYNSSNWLQSVAASQLPPSGRRPVQSSSRLGQCKVVCSCSPGVLHAGEGVLKEFGFNPGRFFLDACAVWLLAAAFAALTYYSLATAGLGSHSGLMLWWRQWLGQVHDDGSSGGLFDQDCCHSMRGSLYGAFELCIMMLQQVAGADEQCWVHEGSLPDHLL